MMYNLPRREMILDWLAPSSQTLDNPRKRGLSPLGVYFVKILDLLQEVSPPGSFFLQRNGAKSVSKIDNTRLYRTYIQSRIIPLGTIQRIIYHKCRHRPERCRCTVLNRQGVHRWWRCCCCGSSSRRRGRMRERSTRIWCLCVPPTGC